MRDRSPPKKLGRISAVFFISILVGMFTVLLLLGLLGTTRTADAATTDTGPLAAAESVGLADLSVTGTLLSTHEGQYPAAIDTIDPDLVELTGAADSVESTAVPILAAGTGSPFYDVANGGPTALTGAASAQTSYDHTMTATSAGGLGLENDTSTTTATLTSSGTSGTNAATLAGVTISSPIPMTSPWAVAALTATLMLLGSLCLLCIGRLSESVRRLLSGALRLGTGGVFSAKCIGASPPVARA